MVALAAIFAYCVSLSGTNVARAADDPNIFILAASPNNFSQEVTRVDVGTTVKWTALGAAPHTITSDGCAEPAAGPCVFDSGTTTLLRNGSDRSTYEFKFNNAGTYAYFCRIHGGPGGIGHSATIIVGSGGAPAMTAAQLRPNVSVAVYSPREGQTIAGDRVTVQLGVNGANLRAPVTGQTDRLNGHFNLILDQPNVDLAEVISAGPGVTRSNTRDAVLENVRPGQHTLTAVWTYDNNVPPQSPISWTVRFTTTAGPTAAPAAAPAAAVPSISPPSTGDGGLAAGTPLAPWAFVTVTALAAVTGVRLLRRLGERS